MGSDAKHKETARAYRDLCRSIAEILADVDPIGIVPGNPEPADEYGSEAAEIVRRLGVNRLTGGAAGESHLDEIVSDVFRVAFDEDIDRGQARRIASRVRAAIDSEKPLDVDQILALVKEAGELAAIEGELGIEVERQRDAPFGEFPHADIRVASSLGGSCPVTIALFEAEGVAGSMTVSFGNSYCELWGQTPRETAAGAKRIVVAVMEGSYEEWKKPDGSDLDTFGLLVDKEGSELYSDFGRTSREELAQKGYVQRRFTRY